MAQKTKTALLKELNTYLAQLQKVDKAALNYLPNNLKVTITDAATTIKGNQEASNEDSDYFLQILTKITKELLKIIPEVELLLNRFSESNGFLDEEIKLIKRCYYLIEGGGKAKSYYGFISDTRCLLTSPELASFKKDYPNIENAIYKVYPHIIPIKDQAKLGDSESVLIDMIKSLKKILGTTKDAVELAKQDRNNETSSSHYQLFQKFIFCSETIDGILDKDVSLEKHLKSIDYQLVLDLIKDINEILNEHTILHKYPVDDNSSNIENVTAELDAWKATLDINILGGIELPKGVRSFNYKGGEESSLRLPLNTNGAIELIVEFGLSETYMSGTGYHKGEAKLYVNYSTTSFGKIELSKGKPHSIDLTKNNSWSKITSINVNTDNNNNIHIIVTLTKHGSSSSSGLSVGVKLNETVSVSGSYSNSWTEMPGVAKQKVFTLSLEPEEAEENIVESTMELEFDNDSAIIRSDDIHTLIDWWEKIGQPNRDKILAKDATIEITGYASPEGTEYYNIELADDRAKEVQNKLNKIIGERSGVDNPDYKMAKTMTKTRGECSEDPRRYVRIEIK